MQKQVVLQKVVKQPEEVFENVSKISEVSQEALNELLTTPYEMVYQPSPLETVEPIFNVSEVNQALEPITAQTTAVFSELSPVELCPVPLPALTEPVNLESTLTDGLPQLDGLVDTEEPRCDADAPFNFPSGSPDSSVNLPQVNLPELSVPDPAMSNPMPSVVDPRFEEIQNLTEQVHNQAQALGPSRVRMETFLDQLPAFELLQRTLNRQLQTAMEWLDFLSNFPGLPGAARWFLIGGGLLIGGSFLWFSTRGVFRFMLRLGGGIAPRQPQPPVGLFRALGRSVKQTFFEWLEENLRNHGGRDR